MREVLLGLPHDLRFAFRMMRRSALVSATIVLCLGFSIGTTGTVFAWMETLILQPLTGVKDFDRLVSLKTTSVNDEDDLSYPDYKDARDAEARAAAKTFDGLAAFGIRRLNLRTSPMTETRLAEPVGIRMALGATPARIVARFLAHAARYVGTGAIAGAALSVAIVYGLATTLPAILPHAPLERAGPFAAAAAALGVVAAMAVLVPAGRAARVNPITALRDE